MVDAKKEGWTDEWIRKYGKCERTEVEVRDEAGITDVEWVTIEVAFNRFLK